MLTMGLSALWLVVDISFLQSNHPFPIGVWHGITSSLAMATTAAWGLAEIHMLGNALDGKKCRFKLFKMAAWLCFMYVSFVELIVLTLIVFFRNPNLPEGFEEQGVTVKRYTVT